MELTPLQAANRIGLSEQRIHKLISDGALPARRLGTRWILSSTDVDTLGEDRSGGRPLDSHTAWGLIRLIEEGDAPQLSAVARSRLRSRLRMGITVSQLARWCRKRCTYTFLRGHTSSLRRVRSYPGAVATGASARHHDLVDTRQVEVYLAAASIPKLMADLGFEKVSAADANVVVASPPKGFWPFGPSGAGPVTVALDLWRSGEPRSRRAATELVKGALAARRYETGHTSGHASHRPQRYEGSAAQR